MQLTVFTAKMTGRFNKNGDTSLGSRTSLRSKRLQARKISYEVMESQLSDVDDSLIECPNCSYDCSSQEDLNIHLQEIHSDSDVYYCSYCSYSFGDKTFFEKHMMCHKDEVNYDHKKAATSCVTTTSDEDGSWSDENTKGKKSKKRRKNVMNRSTKKTKSNGQSASKKGQMNNIDMKQEIFLTSKTISDVSSIDPNVAVTPHVFLLDQSEASFTEMYLKFDCMELSADLQFSLQVGIGVHYCNECNYCCDTMVKAVQHLVITHVITSQYQNGSIDCPHCDLTISSKIEYDDHIGEDHASTGEIYCRHCPFKTQGLTDLEEHTQVKHLSKLREIWLSDKSSIGNVVHHHKYPIIKKHFNAVNAVASNTKTPNLQCPLCTFVGNIDVDLKVHVIEHLAAQRVECFIQCPHCTGEFYSETRYRNHLVTDHNKVDSKHCPFCSVVIFTSEQYLVHLQKIHMHGKNSVFTEPLKNFQLEENEDHENSSVEDDCEKLPSTNPVMGIILSETDRPQCCTDELMFGHQRLSKADLAISLRGSLQNVSSGCHCCSVCDYSSDVRSNIIIHAFLSHLSIKDSDDLEEEYGCPYCQVSVQTDEEFDLHLMTTHNSPNHLYCRHCNFRTSSLSKFSSHCIEVHIGQMPRHLLKEHSVSNVNGQFHDAMYLQAAIDNAEEISAADYDCKERKSVKKCPICPYAVDEASHLPFELIKLHVVRCHLAAPRIGGFIRCYHCQGEFLTQQVFRVHVSEIHKRSGLYHCPLCNFRNAPSMLQAHQKSVHGACLEFNAYRLPSYKRKKSLTTSLSELSSLANKSQVPIHVDNKNKQIVKTKELNLPRAYSKTLVYGLERQRIQLLTEKIQSCLESSLKYYSCSYCEYATDSKKLFALHMVMAHLTLNETNENIKCTHCGVRVKFEKDLDDHLQMTHSRDDELFCRHCNLKTTTHSSMMNHSLNVHLEQLSFLNEIDSCDSTLQDFHDSESIQSRLMKITQDLVIKKVNCVPLYMCPFCSFQTTSKADSTNKKDMTFHIIWKHQASPRCRELINCSHCLGEFRSDSCYRSHVKDAHDESRLYHCIFCNYQIFSMLRMKSHVLHMHSSFTLPKMLTKN